jgi:uncharacterized membrane protein
MITTDKPDKETLNAWHNDPANWKLGIFYYNKLDKRILPPKRIQGMGWTVNFANPVSYLTVLTSIGLLILALSLLL